MEENLTFYLNGRKVTYPIRRLKSFSLLDFLREEMGLTGVKKGCGEGDCGACTVIIGEHSNSDGNLKYKSITSCIYPVFKIDGKHVITVEGMGSEKLSELQRAFIDFHAIQCGFCTPGMIMSLSGLFLNKKNPTKKEIKTAISGNLCRCTGYKSILDAATYISKNSKFKPPEFLEKINGKLPIPKTKSFSFKIPGYSVREYHIPSSLKDFFEIERKLNNFDIVNGGSDLFLKVEGENVAEVLIDISEISDIKYLKISNGEIHIGGGITFSTIMENKKLKEVSPKLSEIFENIASTQIRNVGTISGNISNASPIADSGVILLSLDAELELISEKKKRRVKLKDFYKGYKKTELMEGEIIGEISFKIPDGEISFLKTSKRKDVDIASVNSSVVINLSDGIVEDIKMAFGGVFPYPVRIYSSENFLIGKRLTPENILHAAKIASDEVKPISDVRGSREFRKKLVQNHMVKHLYKISGVLS